MKNITRYLKNLRRRLSQLVLFLLKREGKFRVEMNALGHTIGEVLFQENGN